MHSKQECLAINDISFILSFIQETAVQVQATSERVDKHEFSDDQLLQVCVTELLKTYHLCYADAMLMFLQAVCENRVRIIKQLIKLNIVNPCSINDTDAMSIAAKKGYTVLVKQLLKYPEVNPGIKQNAPLIEAILNGHTETVECLLQDNRVNVGLEDYNALKIACAAEKIEIIKLFLTLDKIHPKRIIWFATQGAESAVRLMLCDNIGFDEQIDKLSMVFAYAKSIKNGRSGIVSLFLNDTRLDPSTLMNYSESSNPIHLACLYNQPAVVEQLLNDGRVDPSYRNCLPLTFAATNGYTKIVQLLLEDGHSNPFAYGKDCAFNKAISHKHPDVAMLFLQHSEKFINTIKKSKECLITPILESIKHGYVQVVEFMLNNEHLNPCAILKYDRYADCPLVLATKAGQPEIVELFLKYNHPESTLKFNKAIREAVELGYKEIVKLLLKDGRADPFYIGHVELGITYISSTAERAVEKNQAEIVLYFLESPKANRKELFLKAVKSQAKSVALAMVEHGYAQAGDGQNFLLRIASTEGNHKEVAELLKNPIVNPAANSSEAMRNACKNGHLDVVIQLIDDKRAFPHALNNEAIQNATKNGHLLVVKRLLQDERIDPFAAISVACQQKNLEPILTEILKDTRILQRTLETIITKAHPNQVLIAKLIDAIILDYSQAKDPNYKKLSGMITWLLEGIQQLKKISNNLKYTEFLTEFSNNEKTLFLLIHGIAQAHYYDEAIHCWLSIHQQSPYFEAARYDAFDCAYLHYQPDKNKMEAFFDALHCCFDPQGKLIAFEKHRQLVFDTRLVEAVGIIVDPNQYKELKLTESVRKNILCYLFLKSVKEELEINVPRVFNTLCQQSSKYQEQRFFTTPKEQQLLKSLSDHLNIAPTSLAALQVMKNEENTALLNHVILLLNDIPLSKTLKRLLQQLHLNIVSTNNECQMKS